MSEKHRSLESLLGAKQHRWLITGAAGFIGSHLVETLLAAGQIVVGLDNFETGRESNLEEIKAKSPEDFSKRFTLYTGSITDERLLKEACRGVNYVLHQAALGSVPRSVQEPLHSHDSNVTGFAKVSLEAREAGVKRFVYASSSAVYGDSPTLPKVEEEIGRVLSPYAATKLCDEIYAEAFSQVYGMSFVGLRYFNVFGPRQDPNGPYAAVIPRWIDAIRSGKGCVVFGDGSTSRDFCYIQNVVEANIRAALTDAEGFRLHRVYNVALGDRTTLKELYELIRGEVQSLRPELQVPALRFEDFRVGDIQHSLADISKLKRDLGFKPAISLPEGLKTTVTWFL